MGIAGWVCVSAIGVVVVIYLLLVYVLGPMWARQDAEQRKQILEHGQLVKCWIVMAVDELWKGLEPGQKRDCHVVFTTTPNVSDLDERLEDIVGRLQDFDPGDNPTEDERLTASVMETQISYYTPMRLPQRVAGELDAYNVSVSLRFEELPDGKLTGEYINCKVVTEGEHAGAIFVEGASDA